MTNLWRAYIVDDFDVAGLERAGDEHVRAGPAESPPRRSDGRPRSWQENEAQCSALCSAPRFEGPQTRSQSGKAARPEVLDLQVFSASFRARFDRPQSAPLDPRKGPICAAQCSARAAHPHGASSRPRLALMPFEIGVQQLGGFDSFPGTDVRSGRA